LAEGKDKFVGAYRYDGYSLYGHKGQKTIFSFPGLKTGNLNFIGLRLRISTLRDTFIMKCKTINSNIPVP